ncbi:uncharacterized protein LOC123290910 isoform X2 [Chrysoperla carnea]|uniref:uncharacterized protein LOC123290910 isoform X2 n=1 Tax=Chrysoperla carnea TaxID=189513 RepID=UPI001D0857A7|nr:uncharacterized protein LOC123290910 isoform X2 [Chrysoperla carnea]
MLSKYAPTMVLGFARSRPGLCLCCFSNKKNLPECEELKKFPPQKRDFIPPKAHQEPPSFSDPPDSADFPDRTQEPTRCIPRDKPVDSRIRNLQIQKPLSKLKPD